MIRITFLALLILAAATIVVTTQPSSAIAPEHGPSAFGQGQFRFFNVLVDFSFKVRANKRGNAHGRAVFENLSTGTQVVVKIDCLRASSSEALMTGTVLHSDDPDFPKLAKVIFAATDGQGTSLQDTITPLFVSPFPDCHNAAPPLTMFQLSEGDIQIEP